MFRIEIIAKFHDESNNQLGEVVYEFFRKIGKSEANFGNLRKNRYTNLGEVIMIGGLTLSGGFEMHPC